MRLLYFDSSGKLTSADFSQKTIPPYAILSHTWGDNEFLFDDLGNDTGKSRAGYKKVLFCGEQAARDGLQYFWVDTCCIDKWNLRELSNAINSMFRWYKNAAKCYAFLSDVSTLTPNTWETSFRGSRWFTRGWTLQELLAPISIDFFSSERQCIGDKASLEQQICEITRIPVTALRGDPLHKFSVPERMSWMVGRQTTHKEDMAYSLIGVFDVSMDFRYGEGEERALKRLGEEIEKADTTPFIIPFDQNTRFIGRESQLAELQGKLLVGASITKVAITGTGGIGKTQLALALVYRTRQKFRNCSVFWISASDNESVHQAYAHIARRLTIPGWDDAKTDARKLVQLHLSKERAGQWLLVIDNVDEATMSLMEFLPSSKQGAIVFTTTDKKTATKLAPQNVMELPEMEQDIAQRTLEVYLVDPVDVKEADLLIQELSYLPLAIVQAAAYVNVNRITLQEYLSLLVEKKKKLIETRESGNIIAATWLISFEQMRLQDTLAADYLLFMACVERNDIPLALLPVATPSEQGIHAVGTLDAYSFVTKRTAESALDLHRLVHVSARNWLQTQGLLSQQTQVAITRLLEVFPDNNHTSRSKWRRLLPHAKFALSFSLTSSLTRQDNEARTKLVWRCALTLYSDGRWKEAEELFMQAIEMEKTVLGDDHPETLISMTNLASTYMYQGRWKEAEELGVQVIETSKRVLGDDHPSTLISMSNLASTYTSQGRWKEAEELFIQATETEKRVLGDDHPETLTSMANLALTYWQQGRWKEAEELGVQVIETRKRMLGDDHPETLISMANLALTYQNQRRWKEAEELFMQAIEMEKRVFGDDHPETLISMVNLAFTLKSQGRNETAISLLEKCVQLRVQIIGEQHPDTQSSLNALHKWQAESAELSDSVEVKLKDSPETNTPNDHLE